MKNQKGKNTKNFLIKETLKLLRLKENKGKKLKYWFWWFY